MLYLIPYLLIPISLIAGFLTLNRKKKWITQSDFYDIDGKEVIMAILAFILWPITLVLIGVRLLWDFILRNVIPE